ncbi:TetR/AcrR family transcriptional regulator [Microvirga sp. 3-52]|uniref:TetR/AcrR family transcriptional regulator n=1 Tax=Microvirga sp. 3-52 TaxID=2792425 RepID=UPI001ACF6DB1|nr:TetR/AcrR family transcriptional regulator [Microvirga sp. 3-52]MBO1907978.1 TetR/AcrR family transcriptional regulator [Microvirga sp. 3-52]MBS7454772.1 TetR/AcrR family transcriptional regulator [Microvirga sp. 3-52]
MHGAASPASGKRVSDRRSIPKSRQILNGAREIFLLSGYAEATMEEIATKAQVSKGTLYNHFDSKDDLFRALIHSEAGRIAEELPTPALEDPNPASALRQMGLAILKVMEAPATVATLRLIVGSLGRFPRLGGEFLTHSLGPTVEQIAIYLTIHEAAGGIQILDKHAAAERFTRWCLAHVMERILMPDQPQRTAEDCSAWVEWMLSPAVSPWGAKT